MELIALLGHRKKSSAQVDHLEVATPIMLILKKVVLFVMLDSIQSSVRILAKVVHLVTSVLETQHQALQEIE
jgi:hypothetical protein